MTLTLLIAAVLLSLSVSATCSLMEATLLSLTPGQVGELRRRHPVAGEIWAGFKADVQRPISVILICNTAAHTIGATVAGAEFERLMSEWYGTGGWAIFVFGALFTVAMLQFTEILPKTLGVRFNQRIAHVSARPMRFLVRALTPVLAAVRWANKPFEERSRPEKPAVDMEEIATLAALARVGNLIDEQQERMIRTAGTLKRIRVRQIMTPRGNIRYLRVGDSFSELLQKLRNSPYTRLPVAEGDLEKVRGVVHLKDVFNVLSLSAAQVPAESAAGEAAHAAGGTFDLSQIMRPVPFVPDTLSIDRLLKQLQEGGSPMAIVVDEFGGVEGLVTVEDVLEELVGEIEDEFQVGLRAWEIVPIEPGHEGEAPTAWRCIGDVPLHEIAVRMGLDDAELSDGTVATLGGYLTRELARWPAPGDVVDVQRWRVRVEAVRGKRVREAVVEQAAPAEPGKGADA